MKQILFALLTLIAVTLCACSSTPPETAAAKTSPSAAPTATAVISTAEMEKKVIELEKKTWDLFTTKKYDESAKVNAPGYQAIYFGKVKPDAEAAEDNKYIDFKSISFSDWKVTFPTKDVAILTYKGNFTSTYKEKDTSGTYVHSSVWVNINGDWKQALYHETKAEPQPKK